MIDLARFDDDDVRVTLFERRTRDEMRAEQSRARRLARFACVVAFGIEVCALIVALALDEWRMVALVWLVAWASYCDGKLREQAVRIGAIPARRFPWKRTPEGTS